MKQELPKDCAAYITDDLGLNLDDVVAHRLVRGEEPKYAVLMKDTVDHFLVVFVGRYSAIRSLGDYEEAYAGNAKLDGWECLYDSEPWEHPVGKFKNADRSFF